MATDYFEDKGFLTSGISALKEGLSNATVVRDAFGLAGGVYGTAMSGLYDYNAKAAKDWLTKSNTEMNAADAKGLLSNLKKYGAFKTDKTDVLARDTLIGNMQNSLSSESLAQRTAALTGSDAKQMSEGYAKDLEALYESDARSPYEAMQLVYDFQYKYGVNAKEALDIFVRKTGNTASSVIASARLRDAEEARQAITSYRRLSKLPVSITRINQKRDAINTIKKLRYGFNSSLSVSNELDNVLTEYRAEQHAKQARAR